MSRRKKTPEHLKSAAAKKGAGIRVPRPQPNRLGVLRRAGVVLSQQQVAILIGSDPTTVSRHESGERSMTREQMMAYAQLYRVPSAELFVPPEGFEDPPHATVLEATPAAAIQDLAIAALHSPKKKAENA